jgi:3-oxoacyl-[acyl-carrier-protein] synthase-1
MACSVGLNAAAACAAMRAGVAKFDELVYLDNQREPIIGAAVPVLSPNITSDQRLIELLVLALTDCLQEGTSYPLETVPLIVGLAEPERPGVRPGLIDRIISQIQERLQVRFHQQLTQAIPQGHTAGFEALKIARRLFQTSEISACLICGVDSYINARSLLWLDQHSRLKTDQNSDGVIPGEAAAAVLIQRQASPGSRVMVKVTGLGFGHELVNVSSDGPLLGLGLTEATRAAFTDAGIQMHEIDFRLSDVTGESYGFKEQSLALARLLRVRREEFPIWHYADSIGDTGAAAGVCQLVIAFQAFLKHYSPGDVVLCCCSAVHGNRAVAVIQREGN